MNQIERKLAFALAGLFSFRMLGLFMILPVFAIYGGHLQGATPALIGLAIGIYGLTQACFQVPLGYLSDKIGRKRVILGGLLIFGLGSVVAALSDHIAGVIAGRALQGSGAIAAAAMALLSDMTRPEVRSRAMALVGVSIGLSFSLALIVGPVVAAQGGLAGVFWVTALLALLGCFILLWVVPNEPQRIEKSDPDVAVHSAINASTWRVSLNDKLLMRLNLGVFVLHFSMTAAFVAIPVWLLKRAELEVHQQWWVYLPVVLISFFAMVPVMMAAERRGQSLRVIQLASALLGIALLMLAGWHGSAVSIALGLFVFFFGFNLLEAMLPSLVSRLAPVAVRGTSMGVYSTFQFLGAFAGGAAGGLLSQALGLSSVLIAAAILVLGWLLFSSALAGRVELGAQDGSDAEGIGTGR